MNDSYFIISKLPRNYFNSMKSPHSHSFCELYYLSSGECDLRINQTTYTLTPGMIMFVPSNVPHKTTYRDSIVSERLTIEFSPHYISDLADELGAMWIDSYLFCVPMYIPVEERPGFEDLLNTLMSDTVTSPLLPDDSKPEGLTDIFSNCMQKLNLQKLIVYILRNNTHADYISTDEMQISDLSVREAISYIDQNYAEPLTLDALAKRYRLNSSYFSNKFKAVNGIGFKEHLNNVRIIHAEKLLLETDLSITEIAMQCGYESSNYFGDTFRRLNGVSPSHFRKMNGNV